MRPSIWRVPFLLAVLLPATLAAAQQLRDASISESRVREAMEYLADDARGGRDTPSPGLEECAQWLAQRFAAAGLRQVAADSWFHEYSLPGLELDSQQIAVKMQLQGEGKEEFALVADRDVRLWRSADVASGDFEACTVARIDDPVLQRLLQADSGRRPIVLEVPEEHPFWQRAAGQHTMLGARRAAARPIFLLREGLLPAVKAGAEATWAIQWQAAPATKVEIPLKNVVACLPGADKKDEYVVVSAHYDHIGIGDPVADDAIYNGADDNASGTTGVLLLAEALAQAPPLQRSVLFVCFSAEEKGLRGSAAFVADPPVPLAQMVINLNLEMLGRPEPGKEGQAWLTGADYSDLAAIAAPVLKRAEVELTAFPMATMLFGASDNYSFAKAGVVAHSLSAGSLHRDYHRPSDELSKIDLAHMTRVLRGVQELVVELANREELLQWNEKGRQRLQGRNR